MYAIIECSGHQYRVEPRSVIDVHRLHLDKGADFTTDKVMLVSPDGDAPQVGTPYVKGFRVKGTVLEHYRDRKVVVFKMKRRKNYRRRKGHRQEKTRLRIESIETA